MQSIKAEVILTIPADKVIISKAEYEDLKQANGLGRVIDLKEFANLLGRKERWVKDNLLHDRRFKRKLDVKNGGFVHYPAYQGDPYSFLESEARKFITDCFEIIFERS